MKKYLTILCFCICLCFSTVHVLARAGGGSNNSSSSSSSSSYHRNPRKTHSASPGASAIIMISALSLIAFSKRYKQVGPALMKHRQIKKELPIDASILDHQVKEAYFTLQEGWTKQDLNSMRPYLSPSLYSQWDGKLNWMNLRHEKNVLLDIELKHAISCRIDGDAVYYLIEGKMIDYTLDDRNQQFISGSYKSKRFIEYWKMIPYNGHYVLDEIWQENEFKP